MAKIIIVCMIMIVSGCEMFSYNEFTYSDTAKERGIVNSPNEKAIENGRLLYQHIITPVRNQFPNLKITSGFRNEALNAAVGGVDNSQHIDGQAVDFVVPGTDHREVARWIMENLAYDQLILEPHWIHVSYAQDNNRLEFIVIK